MIRIRQGRVKNKDSKLQIAHTYSDQTQHGDLWTDYYDIVEDQIPIATDLIGKETFFFLEDNKAVLVIENKVVTYDRR